MNNAADACDGCVARMLTRAGPLDVKMLRALISTETFPTWTALSTATRQFMRLTTIYWNSGWATIREYVLMPLFCIKVFYVFCCTTLCLIQCHAWRYGCCLSGIRQAVT